MLIDEVKIKVSAGKGGDGIVSFDKIKMSLGPTGGRGGNGGNVFFEGVSDIFALNRYRHKKIHEAQNGKQGRGQKADGPAGTDLILPVPVGTIIENLANGKKIEIVKEGERKLAAKGGIGGRGNFYFRSSINTSPRRSEKGKPGESFDFFLELRLIAEIGLFGLPNAGKSSLLNELTAAQAKVGNYHFTTLEPNLGSLDGIIIADIPGLIEGASRGRGLGFKFLRHIQRTRVLAHCLSAESKNFSKDYQTVRRELEIFSPELEKKKEIILLTKADLLSKKGVAEKVKELSILTQKKVLPISIHNLESLNKTRNLFLKALHSN